MVSSGGRRHYRRSADPEQSRPLREARAGVRNEEQGRRIRTVDFAAGFFANGRPCSFSKQLLRRRCAFVGTPFQLGSLVSTPASVSEIVSPWNNRRPVSIS